MNEQDATAPGDDELRQGISRRDLMIKGGSLAAVAWAAPGLTRLNVAYAAGTLCDAPTDISAPFTASQTISLDPGTYRFDVWGGGGGGGATNPAAGGGGGGFSSDMRIFESCTDVILTVGAGGAVEVNGGDSSVSDGGVFVSAGGGGAAVGANAGTGGTGDTSGGNGTAPVGTDGGNGGAGGGDGGGAGGTGTSGGNQLAPNGAPPGGGGGGGSNATSSPSGAGARGEIRVTVV